MLHPSRPLARHGWGEATIDCRQLRKADGAPIGRLPLSRRQAPASVLVLGAGRSGMSLLEGGTDATFHLSEWVFSPYPLVLFAVAAWLLVAGRKPVAPGGAPEWTHKDSSTEFVAADSKPQVPSAKPRSLPPPSSPDSIYLQMRLRLAKKSAEEEAAIGTRFVVRFSCQGDSFCENPVSGGTFRLRAGVPYILEFDSLAGCSSLAAVLQRNSQQVEYQVETFRTPRLQESKDVLTTISFVPNRSSRSAARTGCLGLHHRGVGALPALASMP